MDTLGISPVQLAQMQPVSNKAEVGATDVAKGFGALLNDALAKLNEQQMQVDQLNEQFVKGELADVHQLMIASEKATLGVELTVQVRNKMIEAYQEIMRMQI